MILPIYSIGLKSNRLYHQIGDHILNHFHKICVVISSKTKLLNNHLAFCNTPDLNFKFIDFDE